MTIEEITQLAGRLGKQIAESPEAKKLREARAELRNDSETHQTLQEYQKQSEKMSQLRQENKPIEVGDKHRLEELEQKLTASETFKRFTAAQVDYVDLMRKVNDALSKHLSDVEGPAAQPPTGRGA